MKLIGKLQAPAALNSGKMSRDQFDMRLPKVGVSVVEERISQEL
jgi:hypothetical protein